MSWQLVEGVPLPDPVGGHPALDFCNTRAGWGTDAPKEYLTSVRALGLWAREAGLLDPADVSPLLGTSASTPAQAAALLRAGALREALYACALRRGTEGDWALVAHEAAAARAASVLAPPAGGGPAAWRLTGAGARRAGTDAVSPLDLPVLAVAVAAEDLLTSTLGTCVAACPGTGCGWVFADPRRRRRWCSMAVCGNRAKARAYAERKRA
ncbi:CGNR zinc finger domain-containing protein [Kineosporia sp. A_224]|uniref:CGNR zinc finger domain-containing protein n=1 Tax=Kineosporia sp. A_224 TaxID=1962180 RepID=UPI00130453D4|nr:CGNR zinc finger domain-containing protein [Kineosporia sp. A_224]